MRPRIDIVPIPTALLMVFALLGGACDPQDDIVPPLPAPTGTLIVETIVDGMPISERPQLSGTALVRSRVYEPRIEGSEYIFEGVPVADEAGEVQVSLELYTKARAQTWNATSFSVELAEGETVKYQFIGQNPPAGEAIIEVDVVVDGEPVGPFFSLADISGPDGFFTISESPTEVNGRYQHTVDVSGRYLVELTRVELAQSWNQTEAVVVPVVGQPSIVHFIGTNAIQDAGTLRYDVVIDGVQVAADVHISVRAPDGTFDEYQGSTSSVDTPTDLVLPPGRYRIELTEESVARADRWNMTLKEVTIDEGSTATVNFVGESQPMQGGDPVPLVHDGQDTFGAAVLEGATITLLPDGRLRAEVPVQWAADGVEDLSWSFGGEVRLPDDSAAFFQANHRPGQPQALAALIDPNTGLALASGPTDGSAEANPLFMEAPIFRGERPGEFILEIDGQRATLTLLTLDVWVWGALNDQGGRDEIFRGALFPDMPALWEALP